MTILLRHCYAVAVVDVFEGDVVPVGQAGAYNLPARYGRQIERTSLRPAEDVNKDVVALAGTHAVAAGKVRPAAAAADAQLAGLLPLFADLLQAFDLLFIEGPISFRAYIQQHVAIRAPGVEQQFHQQRQ